MHNELTAVDIAQMEKEIKERQAAMPALRAEVKRTRDFGDLSENDEYKSAKRDFNKNKSRIRYLQNMIDTAIIIDAKSEDGVVGLFDSVKIFYPEDNEERVVKIVTTLRNDVLNNIISKESPFGRAILGHKVGDTVIIQVNEKYSYPIKILEITKGEDTI